LSFCVITTQLGKTATTAAPRLDIGFEAAFADEWANPQLRVAASSTKPEETKLDARPKTASVPDESGVVR
jgi:hypothetical protein